MGILFVLTIALPTGWCIVSTVQAVARARVAKFWIVLALLIMGGAGLGWHWANWRYHTGEQMQIAGFPIPLVFFHLENDQWVDVPLPAYLIWPGMVTDIFAGVAALFLPFRLFLGKNS